MRILVLGCAVLAAMAGCVSPEADAERAVSICEASGVAAGSTEFRQCVSQEVQKAQDRRDDARLAIGSALQGYGDSMQQQSQYQRPIYCTSNAVGGYTYTNCR